MGTARGCCFSEPGIQKARIGIKACHQQKGKNGKFVHSPAHRARRGVDPGAQVQAAFMQHIHQHQQRNAQQQQEQFQLAGQA
mgnify:CR=1 FL=1